MLQADNSNFKNGKSLLIEVPTSLNRIYHNAKALLQIYSKSAWETSDRYTDIVRTYKNDYGISDIDSMEILASLGEEKEAEKLAERLLSVCKNKMIIDAIDSALLKLKDYPYHGELYYQIIYKNYLVKYKYTEVEIIESLSLSRTTYYRKRKEAINLFGICLWKLTIPKVLKMFGTKMGQNWDGSGTDAVF
ncbi:MAG: hypothetical protein GX638_15790 [Crenarchaeota archaeon]|nr:hypothetical protein [Thermoproteota archaeon]